MELVYYRDTSGAKRHTTALSCRVQYDVSSIILPLRYNIGLRLPMCGLIRGYTFVVPFSGIAVRAPYYRPIGGRNGHRNDDT